MRAIRQRHSHTGSVICLRAFTVTVKRQSGICVCSSSSVSRVGVYVSLTLPPRGRGHDSRHGFRRSRYRVSHFRQRHALTLRSVSRGVYVIYARRIIRELAINHSSRPSRVTATPSPAPPPPFALSTLRQIVLVYTTSAPERAASLSRERMH